MGEGASHFASPATNAGGRLKVPVAEVESSAVEEDVEDRGRHISPGREGLAPPRLASSAPMTLGSSSRARTSPALSPRDDVGKVPSPTLGPEGVELLGRGREVDAALISPSIFPEHRAMLGVSFRQFQSAKAGVLDVFLNHAKGFEVSIF